MTSRDWLRKITPDFILNWNRTRKKHKVNQKLKSQLNAGSSFTKAFLIEEFQKIGLRKGDCVLVHSSLSKIGHLENGPKTFVDALIETIGVKGHILMPTSPNNEYQLTYIRNTPVFDVLNSPSKTGAITEYFRKMPNVVRSLHPTEPVSVLGPKSQEIIKGHFKALTPYKENSPFSKVAELDGKILYVGVTLDNAGTSLHTLEDAVDDFKFPVYYPENFKIDVIDNTGNTTTVETKVHDPKLSKLRKCDHLIPHFKAANVLEHVTIGNAATLLVDAKGLFNTMLDLYNEKGVTMYTPNGENLTI